MRPTGRRLAAALTVATAGAVLSVVSGAGSAAVAAPATVQGGHLDWGVKQSFRNYIVSPIAHGSITVTGGATRLADGTFRFPATSGTVDPDADTASVGLGGTVEFRGHDTGAGPQLQLIVTGIEVRFDGAGGTLVADVSSRSLASGELTEYRDVEFADLADADLTSSGGVVTATAVAATLTEAGVPAFADFYGAGTALDPVTLSATADWRPSVTVSERTGLDPDGETITVGGTGFDPAANTGTRPPLAGRPSGIYVVFAKIAEPWRPSQGAPSANRTVIDQRWVLPAASRALLDPAGTDPRYATLGADGSFSTTLDVAEATAAADCSTGTCAVITYAGGGATNAAHETATVVTFADDEPTSTPPATTIPTTTGPSPQITDARLTWGVKQSFRQYIAGPIAHGGWTTGGGVTDDGGVFTWTELTDGGFDADGPSGTLGFGGSVRFTGHDAGSGPLLDVTVAAPRVRVGADGAVLLLDVRSKGLERPGEWFDQTAVEFAALDLSGVTPTEDGGVVTFAGVPATLTEAGAAAFAGFYQAGAELDALTFAVALDGAVLPTSTTVAAPAAGGGGSSGVSGGALATTGGSQAAVTSAGGLLVLLGGMLLLVARRRRAG